MLFVLIRGSLPGLLVLAQHSEATSQGVQRSVDVICLLHAIPSPLLFAAFRASEVTQRQSGEGEQHRHWVRDY